MSVRKNIFQVVFGKQKVQLLVGSIYIMYLYTVTYLLLVNMKYVTCMLRILHLLCPIIFCKITSAFAYFCNMYLTCAPQCYSLLTPCNEIQCPLLSNWEKSNICKMQYAIYNICTMQYFAIRNMQYAILCNLHVSLVPPIGGVEIAWHDDKVVNPVADVEQAKHLNKEKF